MLWVLWWWEQNLRRILLHCDSWWSGCAGLWKRKGIGIGPGLMGGWNVGRMDSRQVEIDKDRMVGSVGLDKGGVIVQMFVETEKAASNGGRF